jgi:acetoin:2,6-dichlorophenolindophenol oxidoreductase subunit beta
METFPRLGAGATDEEGVVVPKWRMNQAIAAAIADEMEADSHVLLLGEDVADAGGVFKTSDGLLERFGPERVRDTPIAEMGFLGLAVGAAACGYRPIVEIMFAEFAGVALDQLATEAAKFRYLSRGAFTAPIVVRMSVGPGLGFGAQHSQTLETWFTNTPGMKVISPSGADSAYGLLRAAIRDDDPVVILEPRILYGEREEVDVESADRHRIGIARVTHPGTDVTLVALGQTVATARAVAAASSFGVEVIDLGSIYPWDVETVTGSVRKTGRLATIEANPYHGGWGADVVAEVTRTSFPILRDPAVRFTCPDVPTPYARALEEAYVPSVPGVTEQLDGWLSSGTVPAPWWKEFVHG